MIPNLIKKFARFKFIFKVAHYLPITTAYILGVHVAQQSQALDSLLYCRFYQRLAKRLYRLDKPIFSTPDFVFDYAADLRMHSELNLAENLTGYLCTRLARSGHAELALELLTAHPALRQYRLHNVFFSDLHSKIGMLDIGFITLFFGNEQAWPKTINIIANSVDGEIWIKDHFDMIICYLTEHESLARGRQQMDNILLPQNFLKKTRTMFLKHTFKESYSAIHYLLSHYPKNLVDISEHQKWSYLFFIEQYESFLDYPFFQKILSAPTLLHQLVTYRLSGQHALGPHEKQQMQKIILIAQGHGNLNNVISIKTLDYIRATTFGCDHNVLETAVLYARNIHQKWLTDFLILWMAAGGKPRMKFSSPGTPEMRLENYLVWTQAKFLLPYIKEFRMQEIVQKKFPVKNIKKI